MADMKEPAQPKGDTVSKSDFIAFKKGSIEREKRLKEELSTIKADNFKLQSELKVARMDADDDEDVSKVRAYLLEEEKRINDTRAKLDEDLTSFNEREKESRVQTLASKYGVESEVIATEDDPEKRALELYSERLTREAEEMKKKITPESIYESGTRTIGKKMPADMSNEEFEEYRKELKQQVSLSTIK